MFDNETMVPLFHNHAMPSDHCHGLMAIGVAAVGVVELHLPGLLIINDDSYAMYDLWV